MPKTLYSAKEAKNALTEKFGRYENISRNGIGLHNSSNDNYTYRNVPIGLCYTDWYKYKGKNCQRSFYYFFAQTKAEADELHNSLVNEMKQAGIRLTKDNWVGMSNRNHYTKPLNWVYVKYPEKVTKTDEFNKVNNEKWVGMYR